MNKNTKPYNWSLLYTNKDIQKSSTLTLKEKLTLIRKILLIVMYQAFYQTTLETAYDNISLKHNLNKRVPWENNTISENREYFKRMSLVKIRAPDTYNIDMYNTTRKDLVNI